MKRKIIPYNPKLKPLAKKLREKMTLSEVLLWNELKSKKMHGFDFDRQRPIDNYIVDFYCKRFDDIDVKKDMNNVLREIEKRVLENRPTPNPSEEGNQ
jgi:hypothetical protein